MISNLAYAQKSSSLEAAKVRPLHQITGIVGDSTNSPIKGVTINLSSGADSLVTTTNDDGIFIFENVKSSIFKLTINAIGYENTFRKYYYNDSQKSIVLDPININVKALTLHEVKIDGRPSIVYKTDTVEYKASDYISPQNASVAELLKSMEGMEVGDDGSLRFQGQQVKKAKLNGKEFGGGDVAQAINNLPADIIEKVQIIDDYGDLATRTGVKNGESTKTLNLTTLRDKSVGNYGRITGSYGTDDRYNIDKGN